MLEVKYCIKNYGSTKSIRKKLCRLDRVLHYLGVDLSVAPSEPRNFAIMDITSIGAFVEWVPPEKTNGPVLGYAIKVFNAVNRSKLESILLNNTTTSFTLDTLTSTLSN